MWEVWEDIFLENEDGFQDYYSTLVGEFETEEQARDMLETLPGIAWIEYNGEGL